MDKDTRNAIERATQRARKLIEDDFASQLEGTFDVVRAGTVAAKAGPHLAPRQVFQRDKIVAAIEHKRAAGMSAAEAVVDYLRDAAFTALNRFVALKMLEARELVQECVTKGEQSAGYREFCGLAPGVALLPESTGYRLYIESLFDELSTEMKVLFDRRDPASVLWPKRATFEALLGVLNATDLSGVWGEDETIGWVYQFFNSGDERKRMREESQAPRNSRELAVRNQFFTPRYVVEFLVDNTLGRTWLEMHGDGSGLAERCRYFVRSEEERTRARPRKDPRDLRVLDPACGSGHFLLYCFDLLLTIYEEAWAAEASGARSHATGRTLRDDYPDLANLRRATPALILEHNLHGVDIDARAAQIAALALWLRAQRAWKDVRVPATERPPVRRTHVVVAEPMPGDTALVEEFAARLDPPLLRDLFRKMVNEMRLAGELGPLIPVEEGIAAELHRAREQFVKQRQTTGFLPGMDPVRKQGELDISGIDDDNFFHAAEASIVEALRHFAEAAAGGASVRRRLFAGDTAQGIALIDLLRTRFDVVLMNPPFGAATPAGQKCIEKAYPSAKPDILAAFVARARQLAPSGLVGAITNRTCLFITSLSDWRRLFLLDDGGLQLLVDLGHGVLDGALVEAACYVLSAGGDGRAISALANEDKEAALNQAISCFRNWHHLDRRRLSRVETAAISYWAPPEILDALVSSPTCEDAGLMPRVGLQTSDDFRFLRLQWELSATKVGPGQWVAFAKGGEYSPFADNIHLAVNWFHEAKEQRAFASAHADQTGSARGNDATRDFEWYYQAGLTYSERTTSDISVRILPEGCITGTSGPGIFSRDTGRLATALGYFCSAVFRQILELSIGSGDAVESGSAARHYTVGNVARCPFPALEDGTAETIAAASIRCVNATRDLLAASPTAAGPVCSYAIWRWSGDSLAVISQKETERRLVLVETILEATALVEDAVLGALANPLKVQEFVVANGGIHPCARNRRDIDPDQVKELLSLGDDALVDRVSQKLGFSRVVSKKTWYADRRLELACAYFEAHPSSVIRAARAADIRFYSEADAAADLLESALGTALGDIASRPVSKEWSAGNCPVFDPVWGRCTRVVGEKSAELLVDDDGHRQDIVRAIGEFLRERGWDPSSLLTEIACTLGATDVREVLRGDIFARHLARFSRSRRKAPIYWQLSTASSRYSVWLFAHRLTRDSFFQVQNDVVGPKLTHEERQLTSLMQNAGRSPSAPERKEIAAQEAVVEELRAMLDEVKRVAPLWNPNLDDGVVLTMAPLWRLVPQCKPWQKDLKAKWDELSAGKYDWAHLAMHLWPERVVPKCATDRSLAIAHGVEDVFWVEGADGTWKSRTTPLRPVEELVRERSSPAVKVALKSLLDAPTASGTGRARGRRAASPAATEGGSR